MANSPNRRRRIPFLERLGIASPPAPLCSLPEDGGSKSLKTVDFSRDSSYQKTESTSPPPTRSPTVSFVSEDFDYSPADNKAPVAYIPLADQLSQISPSKKESLGPINNHYPRKKAGASGGALSESDKDKVIADLEDDYKQLSQAHDNGKQMVKDLEAELQSTSDRLKALEENYKTLTDKKMDLDSELATARLTLEKQEALVEGLHSEKSGLAERLQLLEQHLERSKEQLEEHQQTAEAKHREAEQHLETIRRLERAADDPRSSEKEKELYQEWAKAEAALLAQWEEAEAALLGELDRHEKKRQVEVHDATAAAYLVAAVLFLVLALGECAAPGGGGGLAELYM
mmetsp:Transcript_18075/g.28230  ORF Transcript_18075/g.28230 Transcript_18075/m.28230 type:complete len:344 (-) Transcript_18075:2-1033(-)